MEAEAAQPTDAVLEALVTRLAELEPQQQATTARIERLEQLAGKAGPVRQLILKSDQLARQAGLLQQQKGELTRRLRKQRLSMQFLEEVLSRYEAALDKATTPAPDEQQSD